MKNKKCLDATLSKYAFPFLRQRAVARGDYFIYTIDLKR
jgi:hypothetical protein